MSDMLECIAAAVATNDLTKAEGDQASTRYKELLQGYLDQGNSEPEAKAMASAALKEATSKAAQTNFHKTLAQITRLQTNADLIKAIRSYVWTFGPSTAYEIAEGLAGSRWQPDTVRTACARAGLKKACGIDNVVTPGGRPCALYCLPTETVPTHGRL